MMSEESNDKRICDLFTKGSHHHNLSAIYLMQNLYYQGKECRTMSFNRQYLVLFNNPRDQQSKSWQDRSELTVLSTYRMATRVPQSLLDI